MISIKSLVTILALLFALLAANSEARGGGGRGRGGRGGHGGGKKQKSSYFDSLTFTTISDVCDAESDIVTCQLRKDADGVESGAFVCRNTTCHHDTTTTVEAAMCVHVNRTLSTDECGCCGGDCPELCSECACTETVTHHRRSRTISGFEMVNSTSGDIICVEEFKTRDLVARGVATCNSACS